MEQKKYIESLPTAITDIKKVDSLIDSVNKEIKENTLNSKDLFIFVQEKLNEIKQILFEEK